MSVHGLYDNVSQRRAAIRTRLPTRRCAIANPQGVTMIIERIAVLVAPEKREDLRRAFSSLLEPTCVEPGCICCDLYQESGNQNRFCLETRWKSEPELVRHLRSEKYRDLLMLLELGSEPPLVEFHAVAETKGLDLVRAVR